MPLSRRAGGSRDRQMKYVILPRPHANSRYQAGALKLARAEAAALLKKCGVDTTVSPCAVAGVDGLTFEAGSLDARALDGVSRCAHLYLLCVDHDGLLEPVCGPRRAALGGDLSAVLKYKGKTNEVFTAFLLNMALCASDCDPDGALTVLDPMCGRGTTLFTALNAGYDAVGVDRDDATVNEGLNYFTRYLSYHHIRHTSDTRSLTAGGKEACAMRRVSFAADPQAGRQGEKRTLQMARFEGENLNKAFKKPMCDLIVCDLPYGVQHAPGAKKGAIPTMEDMLYDNLAAWVGCLRTGGAVAVAFNTNTLKTDMARGLMAEAGLDVVFDPDYDGLDHWVEQAITRDIAVAVRRF